MMLGKNQLGLLRELGASPVKFYKYSDTPNSLVKKGLAKWGPNGVPMWLKLTYAGRIKLRKLDGLSHSEYLRRKEYWKRILTIPQSAGQ